MERKIIILLTLVLVMIGVTGCVKKMEQTNIQQSKVTVANSTDKKEVLNETKEYTTSVSNIPNIVEALTCMFSPDTCEKQNQERAMDR